jgi:hypothetical protein
MRNAMREQRLNTGPRDEHLPRPNSASGGVPFASGGDVAAQLAGHARKRYEAQHVTKRRACELRNDYGAKNGVVT